MNTFNLPTPVSYIYLNRYIKFITAAFQNTNQLHVESHHILPKSMGGSDVTNNLVKLSPRQHFIAHQMLWKAYKNKEMTAAFFSMANQNNQFQHRNYRLNSKVYETLKIEFQQTMSNSTKQLWTNEEYRTKHIVTNQSTYTKELRSLKAKELWNNEEYRTKISESRKLAWSEGRVTRDHSKCGLKGDANVAKRPEVREKNSGKNHYSNRDNFIKPSCQHCGITSTPNNIKRWHGDNCKLKP